MLTEGADKVVWKLEKSGKFTTRSVYRFITFGGVIDLRMMEIWRAKISLKLKIFPWMAWHDRIQTAQQLKRRNWDGSKWCKYCRLEESADHLKPVRLVVNDCKFTARIVFFSHTKPAISNNPRSYTIVSVPAEQADCYWIFALPVLLNHASIINSVGVSSE